MITTTGKSIIAKYLIDQAPSYAAYIAVGCGHNPRAAASYAPYAITAANIATNVVNVTATGHTFKIGDYVNISNVNAIINGTYPIASVTGNYFTCNLTATNATNTGLTGFATLNFQNKEKLDFEMFRVPIISRSYAIDENGLSQIVFSAELPTQELYYMSEAGIFSAGSNPVATTSDSRLLYSFSSIENWEYHATKDNPPTASTISSPTEIASISTGIMSSTLPITFFIDNTQDMFSSTIRGKKHLEQPRMLKNSIAVSGNMSNINTSTTTWTTVVSSIDEQHIHLTSQSYPLDVNSSSDEIALAFSLLKRHQDDDNPTSVFILVEFSSEESEATQQYAKMQIELSSADFTANGDYLYFVKKKTLSELVKSSRFSWVNAKVVKVYCKVVPTTRTISNKVLTNNIATVTTSTAHYVAVGDSITVALTTPDAVFDGTYTVTAVTSGGTNTISYAKTNANVGTTATSGTLTRDGQSIFVALDGLRFENNFDMTANPLYGMTAYSPISTSTNTTVFKDANSKNLLDMKLNLDLNVGS